jgi:hypothetical protein
MRFPALSRRTVGAVDPRIVDLEAPEGELVARFATGAGMVGCSLRHRGEELLGLGRGLEAYVREGKVFGIPILYPWANRLGGWGYETAGRRVVLDRSSPLLHGEEHGLPIHGALAATSDGGSRPPSPTGSPPRSTSPPTATCSRCSRSRTGSRWTWHCVRASCGSPLL